MTVRERLQAILRGENVASNAAAALAQIDALDIYRRAGSRYRVLPDPDPAANRDWAEAIIAGRYGDSDA